MNALASADDLILSANTADGLQDLIDFTECYLKSCGLTLNPAMCRSLSIQGQPKQKRTVIEDRKFKVQGRGISNTKRTESFVYLGIKFTPKGRIVFSPATEIVQALQRLTKAPLKPQQRLHALRTVLIPRLYHRLALTTVKISYLKKADTTVRSFVRRWTALPHDTPMAYFHASTKDGGLGVPSIRWRAPLLRYQRLLNVKLPNLDGSVVENTYLARETDAALKRLHHEGNIIRKSAELQKLWAARLYTTVDDSGLRQASFHPQAHR